MTNKQIHEPIKKRKTNQTKKLIKGTWDKIFYVLQIVNKIIDLGSKVFDYAVKVSKFMAVLLGGMTIGYVAKEIPNRAENDTIGNVVNRAVMNMRQDANSLMHKHCPYYHKGKLPKPPCAKGDNKPKKIIHHKENFSLGNERQNG